MLGLNRRVLGVVCLYPAHPGFNQLGDQLVMLMDARVGEDRDSARFEHHIKRLKRGQLVAGDISRRPSNEILAKSTVGRAAVSGLDYRSGDMRPPDSAPSCDLLHPVEAHVYVEFIQALDYLLSAIKSRVSLILQVGLQGVRPVIYEVAKHVDFILAEVGVDLHPWHKDDACFLCSRQARFDACNGVMIRDSNRPQADSRRLPDDLLRGESSIGCGCMNMQVGLWRARRVHALIHGSSSLACGGEAVNFAEPGCIMKIELEVGDEFIGKETQVRYVVMVIPRPGGNVLLMTKSMYPAGVYRLPSGKIHEGETPEEALVREGYEETGFDLHCDEILETITFLFKNRGRTLAWESYIILTNEQAGEPQVQDLDERITDFREVSPCDLNKIADQLESLPPGHWRDWGRFRAVEHRIVYKKLCL